MSHTMKESIYSQKWYQFSLQAKTLTDDEMERQKLKQMAIQALDDVVIRQGLKDLGKTASDSSFAFLTLDLKDMGIFTLIV